MEQQISTKGESSARQYIQPSPSSHKTLGRNIHLMLECGPQTDVPDVITFLLDEEWHGKDKKLDLSILFNWNAL